MDKDMQAEVEQLRTEVAELREAMRLLLALTTTALATTHDSAAATKALANGLRDAERFRPRGDAFWEAATGVLKMLSSKAVQQHPADRELLEIHHGVRPNRH